MSPSLLSENDTFSVVLRVPTLLRRLMCRALKHSELAPRPVAARGCRISTSSPVTARENMSGPRAAGSLTPDSAQDDGTVMVHASRKLRRSDKLLRRDITHRRVSRHYNKNKTHSVTPPLLRETNRKPISALRLGDRYASRQLKCRVRPLVAST